MSYEQTIAQAYNRGSQFIVALGENNIGLYAGPLVAHGITHKRKMIEMLGLFILAEEARNQPENIAPEKFNAFLTELKEMSGL